MQIVKLKKEAQKNIASNNEQLNNEFHTELMVSQYKRGYKITVTCIDITLLSTVVKCL